MQPFGYFVHHQGRGHAARCAAIAHALPRQRPLVIFCARPELFPALPPNARVVALPSLFEPQGDEAGGMDDVPAPDTVHCAPLGWPGIRRAMATLSAWFDAANPALVVCDVSAEVAQLCRLCSVPHVSVLLHGARDDPGHRAAHDGAAGLLAPFHAELAQPEWAPAQRARTLFVGGLGVDTNGPDRATARQRLGLAPAEEMILVMSGAGGRGFAQAPLGVGARATPGVRWLTIGPVERDWHATEPANLEHRGWVDNAADYVAAADLVVASTGDTTCQQLLAAGQPWLAIPEWRYFDEQHHKAAALERAGLATVRPHLPSSIEAWRRALAETRAGHQPARQRAAVEPDPAARAGDWLEALAARLWRATPRPSFPPSPPPSPPSP